MKHILVPQYHRANTLQWTRYLGQFGLDPLNNCSESKDYSMTCHLKLELSNAKVTKNTRACHHDNVEVIDYCHWQENNFCRLYYLIVSYGGQFFSNPHCAQCHGVPLNATKCAKNTGRKLYFLKILIFFMVSSAPYQCHHYAYKHSKNYSRCKKWQLFDKCLRG